jgi:ubiquinone biosynthesis protein
MERWMAEQVGPKAFLRRVKETLPQLSEDLPEVPLLVHRVLRKAVDGELKIQWQSEQLEQIRAEIRSGSQRTQASLGGAGLTLAGVLVVGLVEPVVLGFSPLWLGAGLGGTGLLLLAWGIGR